jgi:hypothetical protein
VSGKVVRWTDDEVMKDEVMMNALSLINRCVYSSKEACTSMH